jgi:ParB-like chromosome segregation protein Spo0J
VAKTLKDIPPEQIDRNKENPRQKFREEALNALAGSIAARLAGAPIVPRMRRRRPARAPSSI